MPQPAVAIARVAVQRPPDCRRRRLVTRVADGFVKHDQRVAGQHVILQIEDRVSHSASAIDDLAELALLVNMLVDVTLDEIVVAFVACRPIQHFEGVEGIAMHVRP